MSSCTQQKETYDNVDDWISEIQPKLQVIGADSLKAKIDRYDEFYLIDVREPAEYYPAYIPTAVNIPGGMLLFKIDKEDFWAGRTLYVPKKTDEIIVYCKRGKRSMFAADMLRKIGYTNVKYLDGGWMEWDINYPTEYEKQLEKLGDGPHEEVGGC
jgi:rhodanese-related sulfurtransferase